MDNFAPDHVYGDATKLLSDPWCYKTNAKVPLAKVDVVIAGTSCKDASSLSKHRKFRRDAIATGSHSTGATFAACVDVVELHQPRLVILENVRGLQAVDPATEKSNLDAVREIMESIGAP